MILKSLEKFFRYDINDNIADNISKYLDRSMNNNLLNIEKVLSNLKFEDNFKSKRIKVTLYTNKDTVVKHNLNDRINCFLSLNGISGIILNNYVENNVVSKDKVLLRLDNTVYNSNTSKEVDLILFI